MGGCAEIQIDSADYRSAMAGRENWDFKIEGGNPAHCSSKDNCDRQAWTESLDAKAGAVEIVDLRLASLAEFVDDRDQRKVIVEGMKEYIKRRRKKWPTVPLLCNTTSLTLPAPQEAAITGGGIAAIIAGVVGILAIASAYWCLWSYFKRAHASFVIEIPLETGMKLGLDYSHTDHGLEITGINEGAINIYNFSNPVRPVYVGDKIVAVNGQRGLRSLQLHDMLEAMESGLVTLTLAPKAATALAAAWEPNSWTPSAQCCESESKPDMPSPSPEPHRKLPSCSADPCQAGDDLEKQSRPEPKRPRSHRHV